uniref:Uncharacterized protein n=1 Tax=Anguilla anguilla TaxID=7936 RepID=A0A0E9WDW9_ANGAN
MQLTTDMSELFVKIHSARLNNIDERKASKRRKKNELLGQYSGGENIRRERIIQVLPNMEFVFGTIP